MNKMKFSESLGIDHEIEEGKSPVKQTKPLEPTDIVVISANNDTANTDVAIPESTQTISPASDADMKEDYDQSRTVLKNLIDKGNAAIEDIADLARQSESARAYEVLATMIKTVADTTKDLYDLQKKTRDITTNKGKKAVDESSISVDKAVVFTGSTADLLKQIQEERD